MKKIIYPVALLMMSALFSICLLSCGSDDNESSSNPTTPIDPVTPSEKEAMSSTDQKEYLEKVALELMDMMPSSDFQTIADLGKYINDTYINDYDWDEVGEWGEDILDAAQEALGTKTTVTEQEKWGSYTYINNYIYNNYKAVLMASNFTGHFTAKNGSWNLTKANDLQFIFNDKSGKQCVVKIETNGNVKKVHAFNLDDWFDYDYKSSGYTYTSNEYYDRTQYTIGIPENIIVTLTQDGSQVIKTTIKIDLGSINNEEFDVSKGNLTISANIELNNGYQFNLSQVAYTANSKASISFILDKNRKSLMTMGAAADINDIPSCNVSEFSSENFDFDDYDTDDTNAKNAFVKVDVLGKVQLQGTISNIRKFVDYLEDADDNDSNEKTFKSCINQANSLTDVNIFYDGKNTKQATVTLEPFEDETWKGRTYWTAEPVINFYDGTSYSTFEAFFNEKDFKKTIDSFKKLANKYANLIDEEIDW
ncbi:MAG: hypothetical protein IJK42_10810 [Prevotella sp.]|nr:hypothetical protein [Prevotella sp.]